MSFVLPEPVTPVLLVEQEEGIYPLERALSGFDCTNGRIVNGDLGEAVFLSSYSYLGLLGHPRINAAAKAAIDVAGTGVHGARILAGTIELHERLERRIAKFHGTEAAIIYAGGYVANLATISALVGPGDAVCTDVFNHASIQDGCRLSGAEIIPFAHNNPTDLRRKLRSTSARNKLIVLDAVYSMEGNIADLPEFAAVAEESGALLMIDEAHSVGVIGKSGKGALEHFDMRPSPTILKMGTLSKSIPSFGGYVAATEEIVRILKHRARGYIFSAALPAPCAAAALEAFDVIEEEPWRVERLQRNALFFRGHLQSRGVDTLRSQTAVIPAICGDSLRAVAASRICMLEGVFALPVTFPAVQHHLARLRLIPLATHSEEDLLRSADVVANAIAAAA